ncbi:F-box protein CPR1-like [Argentina anserina]|uniref:F-box protein CPR1-like n=1 Tax=Argentina anserina TaxID=57926 RepID=UPI00217674E6|nr:F-box protein CPR1-like [Potentilla anserina]
MAGIDLPEDIIEKIFSRLPVKSLIRLTCVSKKYQNLILKDPNFAKTQFKLASGHRLLIRELGSLDLDIPSFDDIGKPNFRFLPPEVPSESFDYGDYHAFAGDCRGVGYLSATDDYKVAVNHTVIDNETYVIAARWVLIFSLRARVWKKNGKTWRRLIEGEGTLSNKALHWLHQLAHKMVVFDLAEEEFTSQLKQLPDFDQDVSNGHFRRLGVSAGGSLCVLCYRRAVCDSMDFWLMREYEVEDSWSKLVNLKLSDPEQQLFGEKRLFDYWTRFLVMKCCAILINTYNNAINFVRIDYKEGKLDRYNIEDSHCTPGFGTKYEETLLWIDG